MNNFEDQLDLICGIHSIVCALKNNERNSFSLTVTNEGLKELKGHSELKGYDWGRVKIENVDPNKLQEIAEKKFAKRGARFQRVPSGLFLECSLLNNKDINWLKKYFEVEKYFKLLVLDQVSDVQNAAAILRTAAFYDVDALIVSTKNNLGSGPNFTRLASGATEFIPIVNVSTLTKFADFCEDEAIVTLALSEHAEQDLPRKNNAQGRGVALFLGSESAGLSNALLRKITTKYSLKSFGPIASLNVNAAAAIAMDRVFNSIS